MPIPKHAKAVFNGIIFTVRQREQEMFDGSYTTFEKATRHHSVFGIPVFGDKICMVSEQQPQDDAMKLGIMGGRVDKGMTPAETMKEELSEELGAECDSLDLYLPCYVPGKLEYIQHIYILRGCEVTHEQHLDPGGEKISLVYVSFEEFIDFVCSEKCHLTLFSNHVMRLKLENKLDVLRKAIFG